MIGNGKPVQFDRKAEQYLVSIKPSDPDGMLAQLDKVRRLARELYEAADALADTLQAEQTSDAVG